MSPPIPANLVTAIPNSGPLNDLPISQQFAQVTPLHCDNEVRLPPTLAKRAVEALLNTFQARGDVLEGPRDADLSIHSLQEDQWLRGPANMKDYTIRMKEFLDHHLMGKPAPKWLTEGVPLLKLKDHLDERAQDKAGMGEETEQP